MLFHTNANSAALNGISYPFNKHNAGWNNDVDVR